MAEHVPGLIDETSGIAMYDDGMTTFDIREQIEQRCPIVSGDATFRNYGVRRVW